MNLKQNLSCKSTAHSGSCVIAFLLRTKTTSPGNGATHSGMSLLYQLTAKPIPYRCAYGLT